MHVMDLLIKFFGLSRHQYRLGQLPEGVVELFGKAKHSIKIVAGELASQFYLNPQIIQALEERIARGVTIEIIHGPDADEESATTLHSLGIKLYEHGPRPTIHFMVVDGKHARVEESHLSGDEERCDYRKNSTYFLGRSLEKRFSELKSEAEAKEKLWVL